MPYQKTYKHLFALLPEHDMSSRIESRVMARIEHRRTIEARTYFFLHLGTIFAAIGVCIPVAQSFAASASQSGLTSYISLFATQGMYMFSSWKDFGLSIIDSIPVIETGLLLGLLLVIGNALRRGTHYLPALHERSSMIAAS